MDIELFFMALFMILSFLFGGIIGGTVVNRLQNSGIFEKKQFWGSEEKYNTFISDTQLKEAFNNNKIDEKYKKDIKKAILYSKIGKFFGYIAIFIMVFRVFGSLIFKDYR